MSSVTINNDGSGTFITGTNTGWIIQGSSTVVTLQNEPDLVVGWRSPFGSIAVSNHIILRQAATLLTRYLVIGDGDTRGSTVTVHMPGSRLVTSADLTVGFNSFGNDALVVSNGGTVDVGYLRVGQSTFGTDYRAVVTGTNSKINVTTDSDFGGGLFLENTGAFSGGGEVRFAFGDSVLKAGLYGNGTLTAGQRVAFNDESVLSPSGQAPLVINGNVSFNSANFLWDLFTNSTTSPGLNFDAPVRLNGDLSAVDNSTLRVTFGAGVANGSFWASRRSWDLMTTTTGDLSLGTNFNLSFANNPGIDESYFSLLWTNNALRLDYNPPRPDFYWETDRDGSWTVANNWSARLVPGDTDRAFIDHGGTNTLSRATNVGEVVIGSTNGSRGGTLRLNSSGRLTASSVTVAAAAGSTGVLQFNGGTLASPTITFGFGNGSVLISQASGSLALSNTISGPGRVIQTGGVATTLSGNNTYTGGTVLSGGRINFASSDNFGPGDISIAAGNTSLGMTSAGVTLANNIVLSNFSGIFTIDAPNDSSLVLNGTISGGGPGAVLRFAGGASGQNTGVLTLNGINTFTGSLEVFRGPVILGNPQAAGSARIVLDSNVNPNGSLQFSSSFAISNDIVANQANVAEPIGVAAGRSNTLAGVVSGVSAINKVGTGTLYYSGNNTYSGGTLISAGALYVGTNGTSGTLGTGRVTNNTSLFLNRSDSFTVSNAISGTGILTKLGAGTVTLSGVNSYSGETRFYNGALALGNDNAIGTGTLQYGELPSRTVPGALFSADSSRRTITNPISFNKTTITLGAAGTGDLLFTDATTYTVSDLSFYISNNITEFSSAMTGSTFRRKYGPGTMIWSGNNTFGGQVNIEEGTLQIGNGTGTGTMGTGNIVNRATLIFDANDPAPVNNRIFGTGNLIRRGAGTTTLSGTLFYTGTTTVESGTLLFNGVHTNGTPGAYTVKSGATLGGLGNTKALVTVENGANITPGAGATEELVIGGLTLDGRLNVFLDGDSTSLLSVLGVATLNPSSSVSFNLGPKSLSAPIYVFLSATNGITGTFGTTTNMPFDYELFYDNGDGIAFLKKKDATNVATAVFEGDNAVIGGGSTNFNVYAFNGSSSSAPFTATAGTLTTGGPLSTNIDATNGVELSGLGFTGPGTNFGTNTGTFLAAFNGQTNTIEYDVVVYDHARGSLATNQVSLGSAIVGFSNALTGSLQVNASNTAAGFNAPLGADVTNKPANLDVTAAGGIAGGSSGNMLMSLTNQGAGFFSTNLTVTFFDDSGLSGATTLSNSTSTATVTVTATIYDHASVVTNGTNLAFRPVHQGRTGQISATNSITISNLSNSTPRVALGSSNTITNVGLSVGTVQGLGEGQSINIGSVLDLDLASVAGQFTNFVDVRFFDDSTLDGASTNVGTMTIQVTGYVYTGQGVWTNSGSGNWTDFNNWGVPGGTPGLDGALSVADTATFGGAGSGTVELNTNASLLALTFSNASSSYTVQGSGTLTLAESDGADPSLTTAAGSHTISNAIAVTGDLQVQTAGRLLLAGGIRGSGSLRLIGAGTTTLAASNSFSGGTVVDAGRVVTTKANAFGSGNVTLNSGGTLDAQGTASLQIGGDLIVEGGTYLWNLYANANTAPGTEFTSPLLLSRDLRVSEDSPFAMYFNTPVDSSDSFWAPNTRRTWRVMESVGNRNSLVDGFSFKPVWATGSKTNGFDLADFFFTLDEANGRLELNYLKATQNLVASNAVTGGTIVSASAGYASVIYETTGLLKVNSGAELIITDPVVMSNNSTTTINGSFVAPGGVTVQSGSTIGGSGTIDAEIVNNGTFAPAVTNSSLTINNDLTFNSGSGFLWTLFDNTTNGVGTNFTAPVALNAKMTVNSGAQFQLLFTNSVNSTNAFWSAVATNSWTVMTGGDLGELQSGTNFTIAWAPGSQTNGFKLKNFYFTKENNNLILNFMPGLIIFPGEDEFDPGVNQFPWMQYQPGGELDIPVGVDLVIDTPVVMNNDSVTIVNGEFTAPGFTLEDRSTLGGNGTINGNFVSRGLISPGNSPGTLSFGANLSMDPSSETLIEAASLSNFDRINVAGSAAVGGTLRGEGFGGNNLSPGDSYQFLTAEGGISGEFDTITVPAGLRGRFLVSGANNKFGTLLIAPATYTSMATTPNQFNVAQALDNFIGATGDRGTVSLALDGLTTAQYPAAFEQMMPSQYASLPSMAFNVANALNSSMFQQLWVIRVNGKGFNAAGVNLAPMQAEMGGTDDMGVFAINPSRDKKWSSFVDGNGVFANASSAGSVQNYRSQSGGVSTGAAYSWTDAFATGVYVGYQGLQAEYNSGRTIDNAVRFGVFGTYDAGDFYFNGLVGGAYHGYTVNRYINFGGLNRTATGRPGAGEFDLALGTGYDFDIGNFSWGPFTTLQYTYIGVQGFNETGAGALNLDVDPYNSSSLLYTLGAQAAYNWKVSDKVIITPTAFAGWQHEFLQNSYGINSTFATGGPAAPFNYNTSSPARDNFYGGVGVTVGVGESWQATFIYSASAANQDNSSQNLYLGLGYKF